MPTEDSTAAAYKLAAARSYEGQETDFSSHFGTLPVEIPLGFQPLGISIMGSFIAVAAYFEPAVMLARIEVSCDDLHFSQITWIRGVKYQGEAVRMFPDLFAGGANRMQNAVFRTPDQLWLTRNGDRRIFIVRRHDDDAWHHSSALLLPGSDEHPLLHSVLLGEDPRHVTTTESDGRLEHWTLCSYSLSGPKPGLMSHEPITPWRYLGARHTNGTLYSVADVRAGDKRGIFANKRRVLDVPGNGIALLDGGKSGALVTRYGQAYPGPFNGIPGSLIYVPPRWLV